MDIVKKAQPDYLFIIERHLTFLPALNSTEAERAVLSKQAESRIDELSAAVKKKLFILNAMPRPSTKIIRILNKKLSQNLYINQSELIEPVDVTFANQVLSRAMKSCENCYLISYDKIFTEGSVFWMYDKRTKLSFFTGGQHLSPYGLLRIATLYKHLCSSL
uniref:SGNH domain-containing protein n=1 Tax=Angiostrongylus cantonensis TaxID=6313 RepID=A0A0K0DEG7_ANGCA